MSAVAVAVVALPVVPASPSSTTHGHDAGRLRFRSLIADTMIVRLGAMSAVSFGFSIVLGNRVLTLLERHGGLGAASAGRIGFAVLAALWGDGDRGDSPRSEARLACGHARVL